MIRAIAEMRKGGSVSFSVNGSKNLDMKEDHGDCEREQSVELRNSNIRRITRKE